MHVNVGPLCLASNQETARVAIEEHRLPVRERYCERSFATELALLGHPIAPARTRERSLVSPLSSRASAILTKPVEFIILNCTERPFQVAPRYPFAARGPFGDGWRKAGETSERSLAESRTSARRRPERQH
jgi:hypothetical protein